MGHAAKVGPSVQLSAVIIRACSCGHPRNIGSPCTGCGKQEEPVVTDLGIIASGPRGFWGTLTWRLWGSRAMKRRINSVNKQTLDTRKSAGENV